MHFTDRFQAGQYLAAKLANFKDRGDVLILALPRGGVEVAYAAAFILRLPWDILVVRKIGLPGHRELGVGAMAEGGVSRLQGNIAAEFGATAEDMSKVLQEERVELLRREWIFRRGRPLPSMEGKTVILVDDGMATGWTMVAAVESARKHGAARVMAAVPVAAEEACANLERYADRVICPSVPPNFEAVGHYYRDFHQCSDEEIQKLLKNEPPASDGEKEKQAAWRNSSNALIRESL